MEAGLHPAGSCRGDDEALPHWFTGAGLGCDSPHDSQEQLPLVMSEEEIASDVLGQLTHLDLRAILKSTHFHQEQEFNAKALTTVYNPCLLRSPWLLSIFSGGVKGGVEIKYVNLGSVSVGCWTLISTSQSVF